MEQYGCVPTLDVTLKQPSCCGSMMIGPQLYLKRGTNGTKEMWSERERIIYQDQKPRCKPKMICSCWEACGKLRFPGIMRNTGQDQIHISPSCIVVGLETRTVDVIEVPRWYCWMSSQSTRCDCKDRSLQTPLSIVTWGSESVSAIGHDMLEGTW
jgi:hypothetical protein